MRSPFSDSSDAIIEDKKESNLDVTRVSSLSQKILQILEEKWEMQ